MAPMKKVTVRRWEVTLAFVILLGSMVSMGILLKQDINKNSEIISTKASIEQLKKGECVLHNFLITSAGVRKRLAQKDTNHKNRVRDLKAARQALRLADGLSNEHCPDGIAGRAP
jgi:hypothetical protein